MFKFINVALENSQKLRYVMLQRKMFYQLKTHEAETWSIIYNNNNFMTDSWSISQAQ